MVHKVKSIYFKVTRLIISLYLFNVKFSHPISYLIRSVQNLMYPPSILLTLLKVRQSSYFLRLLTGGKIFSIYSFFYLSCLLTRDKVVITIQLLLQFFLFKVDIFPISRLLFTNRYLPKVGIFFISRLLFTNKKFSKISIFPVSRLLFTF